MTNGNDSALPLMSAHTDWEGTSTGATESEGGLTKREFFATQALVGLVQRSQYRDRELIEMPSIANIAVQFADALIEALNKEAK